MTSVTISWPVTFRVRLERSFRFMSAPAIREYKRQAALNKRKPKPGGSIYTTTIRAHDDAEQADINDAISRWASNHGVATMAVTL